MGSSRQVMSVYRYQAGLEGAFEATVKFFTKYNDL